MTGRGWLVRLIATDETPRRALEETLADWRQARGHATRPRRVLEDVRGMVSVVRVVLALGWWQMGSGEVWRVVLWSSAGSVVFAALLLALLGWRVWWSPQGDGLLYFGARGWFPLAMAFGIGLARTRPAPVAGVMILTSVLLTALIYGTSIVGGIVYRGLDDVIGFVFSYWYVYVYAAGEVLAAPTFFLLGELIRRRSTGRRSWRAAQLHGGLAALAILAGSMVLTVAVFSTQPGRASGRLTPNHFQFWLMVVMAWVAMASMRLAESRARQREA